jgi:hypothetical protein
VISERTTAFMPTQKCEERKKLSSIPEENINIRKQQFPGPQGSVKWVNSSFLSYRKVGSQKADPNLIVSTHDLQI